MLSRPQFAPGGGGGGAMPMNPGAMAAPRALPMAVKMPVRMPSITSPLSGIKTDAMQPVFKGVLGQTTRAPEALAQSKGKVM